MSKCPICGKGLRRKTNKKVNEELPSVLEVFENCSQCKQYKYELIGPSETIWIGGHEFSHLYSQEDKGKIRVIILITKIKYKIIKFYQKMVKKVLTIVKMI